MDTAQARVAVIGGTPGRSSTASRLPEALHDRGLDVTQAATVDAFLRQQPGTAMSVLVLDATEAEDLGEDVAVLQEALPLVDVLVWEPRARAVKVCEAFRAGARDVLVSQRVARVCDAVVAVVESQQLVPRIQQLSDAQRRSARFENLLSRSALMWDIFEQVTRVAPSSATVLIVGETGTGKELLARAIHRRSGRQGRFVPCNCAAIPEHLLESELFGYEKGAFTGAVRGRSGLVRHADTGTLFLDEIGDMPASAQLSLLRMLQDKRVRPIGSHEEIPVNVRIVAATNVPLDDAVRNDAFREDLFYRLDVIRINVPALRERPEDILFLFGDFVKRLRRHHSLEPPDFADGFLDALLQCDWPGNVRQLENFAERVVLSGRRRRFQAADVTRLLQSRSRAVPRALPPDSATPEPRIDLGGTLDEYLQPLIAQHEQAYLVASLRENTGRIQDTAEQAGISRRTLLRKLRKYGIDKRDYR